MADGIRADNKKKTKRPKNKVEYRSGRKSSWKKKKIIESIFHVVC
jgi:hypothetical protein